MRQSTFKVMALLALAPLASGCSSIFGKSSSASAPELRFPTADEHPAVRAAIAVEEGRAQLAAGNPGLAIESFQRALATGEAVAPAANGIAVAYARIGRADLARRYFQQAIATAPEEPNYVANLERLEASSMPVTTLVAERSSENNLERPREVVVAKPHANSIVRTEARGGISRVSRSEVRITTVAPSGNASTAQARFLERNFEPAVRISLARDNRTTTSTRPVIRITLPEATPTASRRKVVAQTPRDRTTG